MRPVRSFVRRAGRMTAGQRQALELGWARWGLDSADGMIDPAAVFGRVAPAIVEVGFGMGASLAEMAQAQPGTDYIGIEVHEPGVGKLLWLCEQQGIDNVRVYREDAVEVLQRCLPPQCLDGVQLYFPDPWPKKKHHKRRLLQDDFAALVASRLRPGGYFHLATDWQPYAEHMMEVLSAQADFVNRAGVGHFSPRPAWRPCTKFEQRGERLGHGVWDLIFEKI